MQLAYWGSLILYVLFIIAWTLVAKVVNPGFYFAGLVMFSRYEVCMLPSLRATMPRPHVVLFSYGTV